MKISYEWLREYVNTKVRSNNLSHTLTMIGHEVTSFEQREGDTILEMEVTPNRADCLSHIGIAREISAATEKDLKLPDVNIVESGPTKTKVVIEDKQACLRYSARIINNTQVAPSPKWLIKKLESVGLRSVNNIVDITNFVLFETGHPLHAFDLDKLSGEEIIIRKALHGEKIVTIDGVCRELKPGMLIIADKEKPVAIAGVMGGKTTEVTESTKNILLESAYFDPISIRRTALALGLSTDSSYRFERGVDIEAVARASDRAAALIRDVAKASPRKIADCGIKNKKQNNIILCASYVNRLLGTTLTQAQIKGILQRLGFKVKGKAQMEVSVPSFRNDITRDADLAEEIARIYGYENISISKAPGIIVTDDAPAAKDALRKKQITRNTLTGLGFNEIITYSLISRQMLLNAALSEEGCVYIQNPLSKEQELMRCSLLPGALKAVSYNLSRQVQEISVFELSNIYFKKQGAYNETPYLTLMQCGKAQNRSFAEYGLSSLAQIKGVITALGENLKIADLGFEKTSHPVFADNETVAALSGSTMLGVLGRIRQNVLEAFDIKTTVYAAELNLNALMESAQLNKSYRPLPRFPLSYRDISFSAEESLQYKDIAGLIADIGGALIENIECLSEYRGKQIPKGQRGIAIRTIYRSKERTLTEDEVDAIDKSIRENLTKTFNITLR